jgi:hypothetical protein
VAGEIVSWVTTIKATYAAGDVQRMRELFAELKVESVRWRGRTVTIVDDYTTGSKYGPVRPASSALHEIFDPVADSEYYEPWPERLELRTEWREGRERGE